MNDLESMSPYLHVSWRGRIHGILPTDSITLCTLHVSTGSAVDKTQESIRFASGPKLPETNCRIQKGGRPAEGREARKDWLSAIADLQKVPCRDHKGDDQMVKWLSARLASLQLHRRTMIANGHSRLQDSSRLGDGALQAGCSQASKLCKTSRPTAKCRSRCRCSRTGGHCQPGILEGPWKEAAARLIWSLSFAEAAEEVGCLGAAPSNVACWLCWMGKVDKCWANPPACLAGGQF